MRVKANIDEADIGKITPEVRASFTVDAYPNDTFVGQIAEVRLEPSVVQNVVTYGVIISVDNAQLKLKPGMTANLTMIVDEHTDVLTVPNAALRFSPPGLTPEQIAKLVDAAPQPPPPARPAGAPESATAGQSFPRAEGSGGEGGQADGERRARFGNAGQDESGRRGGNAGQDEGVRRGGNRGGRGGGRGGGGGGRNQRAALWTQDPTTLEFKPVRVRLGLNDGTRTEVSGPEVQEGMEILVGDLTQRATPAQQQTPTRNPLLPNIGGGGGRGRGGF
jgi:HlyD family secretion protein